MFRSSSVVDKDRLPRLASGRVGAKWPLEYRARHLPAVQKRSGMAVRGGNAVESKTGLPLVTDTMNFVSLPFPKEFLDQVSDAVIVIDNDHLIAYVNPEAERRYAVSAAEAIGRVLTDIVRYEWVDADSEINAYDALKTRGYWRGENIHLTRHG